jgi:MFS family permease
MTQSMIESRAGLSITQRRDGTQKWHAFLATFLGEAFDAMDATIYFIALVPCLSELLKTSDATTIGAHGAIILATFMIGWAIGSVCFGNLSDRFGRVRTLSWTIILYATATGLCALAQDFWQFAACRFFVGAGIGGEVSVGCVLLGEAWTGSRNSRLWAMSLMQTSFGIGCMLTGLFNLGSGQFGWRYLFLVGVLPALVTLYMRLKLREPESFEKLAKARMAVADKAAANKQLRNSLTKNAPNILIATLMAASAIVGYWAGVSWIPAWINQLTGDAAVLERSQAMMNLSIGGILGCFIVPKMIQSLGYRRSFQFSFLACFFATTGLFLTVNHYSPIINVWTFIIGFVITVPFTLLVAYTCESFATEILGTASGIAWGTGRIFAAAVGMCTGPIIAFFAGNYGFASACVEVVYLVGFAAAFWLKDRWVAENQSCE